uniref:Uncharacterized protein n=1 Tax=Arundo donax TaxID=35708 RepID=A0A0A8YR31_ARUDO
MCGGGNTCRVLELLVISCLSLFASV